MKIVELETVESKISEINSKKNFLIENKNGLAEQYASEIEARAKEMLQEVFPKIKEDATKEILGPKIAEIDKEINLANILLETLGSLITEKEIPVETIRDTEDDN